MAGRSHPSAVKRRRELARLEKRQEKARRKEQRKQEKLTGAGDVGADAAASGEDAFARQDAEFVGGPELAPGLVKDSPPENG
jgi:hypothetical protein